MAPVKKGTETVPAKPFADWLDQRVRYYEEHPALTGDAGAVAKVIEEIGWTVDQSSARRLYRYRYLRSETRRGGRRGQRGPSVAVVAKEYQREIVEEALHHAGVPFEDIYPDIAAAEETHLEPEAWCPGCQASVTPIDGVCAWCDWRLSAPTGQRLLGRVVWAERQAA